MFGLSALYNVSVSIVSDSYDEPHVNYLSFTEPTYVITVYFLPSAEHYYAFREIAPTFTEERTPFFALQQDTAPVAVTEAAQDCTTPVYSNPIDYSVIQEAHIHISLEHPATTDTQEELLPDNNSGLGPLVGTSCPHLPQMLLVSYELLLILSVHYWRPVPVVWSG